MRRHPNMFEDIGRFWVNPMDVIRGAATYHDRIPEGARVNLTFDSTEMLTSTYLPNEVEVEMNQAAFEEYRRELLTFLESLTINKFKGLESDLTEIKSRTGNFLVDLKALGHLLPFIYNLDGSVKNRDAESVRKEIRETTVEKFEAEVFDVQQHHLLPLFKKAAENLGKGFWTNSCDSSTDSSTTAAAFKEFTKSR